MRDTFRFFTDQVKAVKRLNVVNDPLQILQLSKHLIQPPAVAEDQLYRPAVPPSWAPFGPGGLAQWPCLKTATGRTENWLQSSVGFPSVGEGSEERKPSGVTR